MFHLLPTLRVGSVDVLRVVDLPDGNGLHVHGHMLHEGLHLVEGLGAVVPVAREVQHLVAELVQLRAVQVVPVAGRGTAPKA